MSIEAVLKIGKIYRDNNILDEHRYVNKISDEIKTMSKNKDSKGQSIETIIYSIPVRSNDEGIWHIHLGDKEVIDQLNEDYIKELRYLNYKTSDKDSSTKYIFGNIIYSAIENGGKIKEGGNYRLESTSSFFRGKPEVAKVQSIIIQSFSKSFEENIIELEDLLRSHSSVGLCFDFEGKQWYEVEGAMDAVNQKLISEFVVERSLPDGKKVISLGKSLFKTIKSPLFDKEKNRFNDPDGIGGSMPGFRNSGGHKIRNFETLEEVIDLFYAINTAEKKFVKRFKDLGILAIPKSENLTVRQLDNFFGSKDNYENTEEKLVSDLSSSGYDDLFESLINKDFPEDVSFDIVFVLPGSTKPSIDLIEISNLKRSFLRDIHQNIREKRQQIEMQLAEETAHFKKSIKINFNISDSFYQLFDNRTKVQKKYHSHLLKFLPQIYSDTYFRDPVLLPLFIEQVEYDIRNTDKQPNYLILKYHFRFLTSIQKENNMEEITNSQSYKLGKSLGTMSRPFAAWRDNCPIKSFEKSYVGNLTRRVSRLDDVFVLYNYLCEKHTNHPTVIRQEHKEAAIDFAEIRKEFKGSYDRNHCAFGFFDAYFSRDKNESDKNQNP